MQIQIIPSYQNLDCIFLTEFGLHIFCSFFFDQRLHFFFFVGKKVLSKTRPKREKKRREDPTVTKREEKKKKLRELGLRSLGHVLKTIFADAANVWCATHNTQIIHTKVVLLFSFIISYFWSIFLLPCLCGYSWKERWCKSVPQLFDETISIPNIFPMVAYVLSCTAKPMETMLGLKFAIYVRSEVISGLLSDPQTLFYYVVV